MLHLGRIGAPASSADSFHGGDEMKVDFATNRWRKLVEDVDHSMGLGGRLGIETCCASRFMETLRMCKGNPMETPIRREPPEYSRCVIVCRLHEVQGPLCCHEMVAIFLELPTGFRKSTVCALPELSSDCNCMLSRTWNHETERELYQLYKTQ